MPNPWHNVVDRHDINNDGKTTVLDALNIINQLSRGDHVDLDTNQLKSPSELTEWPGIYYDTNGDDRGTVLDALLVINQLARLGNSSGEGELADAAIQEWSRELTPISIANEETDLLKLKDDSSSQGTSFSQAIDNFFARSEMVDTELNSMDGESLKALDESLLNLLDATE